MKQSQASQFECPWTCVVRCMLLPSLGKMAEAKHTSCGLVIFTKLFILFELVVLITILLKLGYLFSIVFNSPKLNII